MNTRSDSRFVRLMSVIGDLDSPYYADERTRFVWYEASAATAQLSLWGGMVISCAMVWLGGRQLLGWSALLFSFVLVLSACMLRYVRAFRAEINPTIRDLRTPSVIIMYLLSATYVVGVVVSLNDWAAESGGFVSGLRAGLIPGLIGGIIATVWSSRRDRARLAREAALADLDEE